MKTLALGGFHLVFAEHNARAGTQGCATGVAKRFARFQYRLLANHPLAVHFLRQAVRVGNFPMAIEQLNGFTARIFKLNSVGPNEVVLVGLGMLIEELRRGRNLDRMRYFAEHRLTI